MALITVEDVLLTVTEPVNDGGTTKYKVSICANTAAEETLGYVYRRFSEFDTVFKRMNAMNPIPALPPLPEKRMFGANDPAFIDKRRLQIQSVLRAIQNNRDLNEDHEFLALICYPPPLMPTRSVAQSLFGKSGSSGSRKSKKKGADAEDPTASRTTGVVATAAVRAPTGLVSSLPGSPQRAHVDPAAAARQVQDVDIPVWTRYPLYTPHESNILAARGWLRSTPFKLARVLPELAAQRQTKTFIEISDANGVHYLLSVYHPRPEFAAPGWESKASYLYRFVTSLPEDRFVPAEDALAESGHFFVVRRLFAKGSVVDQLHGVKNPLDPASKKYPGKVRSLSPEAQAQVLFQLAVTCRALHAYNLPIPGLHLGNVFLDDKGNALLSDVESAVLGACWSPVVLPYTETDADNVTHIDVLKFGLLAVELATGIPAKLEREFEALARCGEPWMPSWNPDGDQSSDDDDDDGATSVAGGDDRSVASSRITSVTAAQRAAAGAGAAGSAAAGPSAGGITKTELPPPKPWPDMPKPIQDLVYSIFGKPTRRRAPPKIDWDGILQRPIFAKLVAAATASSSRSGGGSRSAPPAHVPDVSLPLKKKEVGLFAGAAEQWAEYFAEQEEAIKRHESGKATVKELAKRRKAGGGAGGGGTSSPPTASPTTANPPPAAKPVAKAPAASAPAKKSAPAAPEPKAAPPPSKAAPPPGAPPPPPPPPGKMAKAPPGPPPPPPPPGKAAAQPGAPPAGAPPPPPPPKGAPPPPPKAPPPPPPAGGGNAPPAASGARAALLEEIRKGNKHTYRGS